MNPKPLKKLSLGAESHVTITWKGFCTQSQVLLASIVGDKADGSPSKIFLYHQERVTGCNKKAISTSLESSSIEESESNPNTKSHDVNT